MRTSIKLPALAVTAVLVAGLTAACSPNTVQDATPGTAASASPVAASEAAPAAPEPVETEAPVEKPQAGDELVDGAAVAAAEAAGLRVYNDWEAGKNYAIDATKPLPKAVKKVIATPAVEAVAKLKKSSSDTSLLAGIDNQAGAASDATGRTVIFLIAMHGGRDGRWGIRYSAWNPAFDSVLPALSVSWSHDDALAKTKAWVTKQKNADSFDIIDATK